MGRLEVLQTSAVVRVSNFLFRTSSGCNKYTGVEGAARFVCRGRV